LEHLKKEIEAQQNEDGGFGLNFGDSFNYIRLIGYNKIKIDNKDKVITYLNQQLSKTRSTNPNNIFDIGIIYLSLNTLLS